MMDQSSVAPSIPIPTELLTEELLAAKGEYSVRHGKAPGAKKAQFVEERGFEYTAWDG